MRRVRRGGAYFRIADPNWPDPLDASYSVARGGRWNPPGSFPVLSLNRDVHTSRANLRRRFAGLPYGPELLRPEQTPLLVETTVAEAEYVDVITDAGCREVGLPTTYPVDTHGHEIDRGRCQEIGSRAWQAGERGIACRSEEHTSELQSQSNLVCRLLLEKKKKKKGFDCYQSITSFRILWFLDIPPRLRF